MERNGAKAIRNVQITLFFLILIMILLCYTKYNNLFPFTYFSASEGVESQQEAPQDDNSLPIKPIEGENDGNEDNNETELPIDGQGDTQTSTLLCNLTFANTDMHFEEESRIAYCGKMLQNRYTVINAVTESTRQVIVVKGEGEEVQHLIIPCKYPSKCSQVTLSAEGLLLAIEYEGGTEIVLVDTGLNFSPLASFSISGVCFLQCQGDITYLISVGNQELSLCKITLFNGETYKKTYTHADACNYIAAYVNADNTFTVVAKGEYCTVFSIDGSFSLLRTDRINNGLAVMPDYVDGKNYLKQVAQIDDNVCVYRYDEKMQLICSFVAYDARYLGVTSLGGKHVLLAQGKSGVKLYSLSGVQLEQSESIALTDVSYVGSYANTLFFSSANAVYGYSTDDKTLFNVWQNDKASLIQAYPLDTESCALLWADAES